MSDDSKFSQRPLPPQLMGPIRVLAEEELLRIAEEQIMGNIPTIPLSENHHFDMFVTQTVNRVMGKKNGPR